MGLKELMIAVMLSGIFAIALINMGVNFASNNNSDVSLLNENVINRSYVNLEDSFESFQSTAESNKNASDEEIASTGFNSIILFSALSSARAITGSIATTFNVLKLIFVKYLGVPAIVIGVFSGMLIFIMVLYIWKTMRSGE